MPSTTTAFLHHQLESEETPLAGFMILRFASDALALRTLPQTLPKSNEDRHCYSLPRAIPLLVDTPGVMRDEARWRDVRGVEVLDRSELRAQKYEVMYLDE